MSPDAVRESLGSCSSGQPERFGTGLGVVGLAGFILNFSTLERIHSWYELGGAVCGSG